LVAVLLCLYITKLTCWFFHHLLPGLAGNAFVSSAAGGALFGIDAWSALTACDLGDVSFQCPLADWIVNSCVDAKCYFEFYTLLIHPLSGSANCFFLKYRTHAFLPFSLYPTYFISFVSLSLRARCFSACQMLRVSFAGACAAVAVPCTINPYPTSPNVNSVGVLVTFRLKLDVWIAGDVLYRNYFSQV
jgi:hypothetical protein